MDILIGTRNSYKVGEMVSFLDGASDVKIHYLDELPEKIVVEEDQDSLIGNAKKKALEISKHTNWYVLTSDGGVDIPGLGKKWDILRNQRIVGETKTDKEKVEALITLMTGLKGEERKCTYHLALALAKDGQVLWSEEDITDMGYLVEELKETEIPLHMWMGQAWYYPNFGKTYNELSVSEKEEIRKLSNGLKDKLQEFLSQLTREN